MPNPAPPAAPTEVRTKPLTPEAKKAAQAATSDMDDVFGGGPDMTEFVERDPKTQKPTSEVVVVDPTDKEPKAKPAVPEHTDDEVAPAPVSRAKVLPAIPRESEEEEVVEVSEQEAEEVVPSTTSESGLSPDDRLVEALKKAFPERTQQQQEEAAPELTPEQRDTILKVYKPAADLVTRLTNPETSADAVKELIEGMRTESREFAYQVSKGLVDQTLSQRDQQLTVAQQQQQTKEQVRTQFFTSYPVLKDEKFNGIVAATALILQKEGYVPKDVAEMNKTLAERVEKEVKKFDSSFVVSAKPAPKTTTTKIPAPRASTPGGGKGGVVETSKPKAYNKAQGTEIFD